MARGKKTPSSAFPSGSPATSETPAQIVSTVREDQGAYTDDAQEVPATPAIPALAYDTAEVAWAAVYRWSAINQLGDVKPWADLTDADRLIWAVEADVIINGSEYLPFAASQWEASVRGKIFAAVVRSIAL